MARTTAKTTKKPAAKKTAAKAPAAKAAAARKPEAPRRDIMQEVTDKIVAALEQGTVPWVKPWRAIPGAGMPSNYTTGRPYSGTNVLLLWAARDAFGYETNEWLTFKQAKELGGTVRGGETGTQIVFMGTSSREKEDGEDERFRFWKSFTVFNIAQCDGLPERKASAKRVVANPDERDEWAEAFIKATGADFREGYGEAFYSTAKDFVSMPSFPSFKSSDNFYATSFHEIGHWTGNEKRLNRNIKNRFGDEQYALEELVAELTAAFCCADFGFDGDLRHAGYIQSWIKVLKADKNAFTKAASAASKAFLYLRDLAVAEAAPQATEGQEMELAMAA
jgi:antirestriction protein ArdC